MNIILLEDDIFLMTEKDIFSHYGDKGYAELMTTNHNIIKPLVMEKFHSYAKVYNKSEDISDINYFPLTEMSANITVVRRKGTSTTFKVRVVNFANYNGNACRGLINSVTS